MMITYIIDSWMAMQKKRIGCDGLVDERHFYYIVIAGT